MHSLLQASLKLDATQQLPAGMQLELNTATPAPKPLPCVTRFYRVISESMFSLLHVSLSLISALQREHLIGSHEPGTWRSHSRAVYRENLSVQEGWAGHMISQAPSSSSTVPDIAEGCIKLLNGANAEIVAGS